MTKKIWEVNISFLVEAKDDDDALDQVRDFIVLAPDNMMWAWTSTREFESEATK